MYPIVLQYSTQHMGVHTYLFCFTVTHSAQKIIKMMLLGHFVKVGFNYWHEWVGKLKVNVVHMHIAAYLVLQRGPYGCCKSNKCRIQWPILNIWIAQANNAGNKSFFLGRTRFSDVRTPLKRTFLTNKATFYGLGINDFAAYCPL